MKIKCIECGKVKEHYAKGKCENCYKRPRQKIYNRKIMKEVRAYRKLKAEGRV